MTREIKFRAWDKDNKTMSEPFCIVHDMELYSDKDVVMQYTGLRDKNGKEIYEGDVLLDIAGKNKYRNDYQVLEIGTMEGTEGRPCILPCLPLQQRCTVYDMSMETNRLKVIGNIYENPELLQ